MQTAEAFFLTASPDSPGKDGGDTIPTGGGGVPPLQGGNRMTGKTQGVALGYRIRPRWGRNSRGVGGGSGVGGSGWHGLVCNGPNGARGDSPGQSPGVIRRIMGALKGRNGVWPVVRCEPWGDCRRLRRTGGRLGDVYKRQQRGQRR